MYNISESSSVGSSRATGNSSSTSAGVSGGAYGVSVGASHSQGGATSSESANSLANATSFWDTIGGDTILSGNKASWAPTVSPPQNWGVISLDEIVDFAQHPLFPAWAKKELQKLQTTQAYKEVFGHGAPAEEERPDHRCVLVQCVCRWWSPELRNEHPEPEAMGAGHTNRWLQERWTIFCCPKVQCE